MYQILIFFSLFSFFLCAFLFYFLALSLSFGHGFSHTSTFTLFHCFFSTS